MADRNESTTQAEQPEKGGRPTKLTEELIEKAREYVDEADNFYGGSLLPTVERLSIILEVHRDTLYEWDKQKNKTDLERSFSDIFTKLKAVQADKLLQLGLTGRYNPVITKLMLTKHDYSDKQQVDHTTNGKELPRPILGGASQSSGDE